jgi:hypothetical protein
MRNKKGKYFHKESNCLPTYPLSIRGVFPWIHQKNIALSRGKAIGTLIAFHHPSGLCG